MILLVVFDGLRPDQVTLANTRSLLRLRETGVTFSNHHSTFPTLTRVNVATLFTGCHPGRHGLVANNMFLRRLDPTLVVRTGDYETLQKLDAMLQGRLLMSTSLGEILRANGKVMTAIGVGSSGNAFLHHHKADHWGGAVVHPEFTLPAPLGDDLHDRFGPWPEATVMNDARIERAVTILLEYLLPVHEPAVATLWLSVPDSVQHRTGVGSEVSLRALRLADAQLGRILEHLDHTGAADSTDLLVASDHGHSTINEVVDVETLLIESGIKQSEDSADVLVAGNGGSVLIYVVDQSPGTVRAIVELLAQQPWCGPLFSRGTPPQVAGTFSLSLIMSENQRSPDLLMSFAWDSDTNAHGVQGSTPSSGPSLEGRGGHGSVSPFDIHSVLIAAGPHFKPGIESAVPPGNADVFATVLQILGIVVPSRVDGRVLAESLVSGPRPGDVAVSTRRHNARAEFGNIRYGQELQISRVAGNSYVDKGSAWRTLAP